MNLHAFQNFAADLAPLIKRPEDWDTARDVVREEIMDGMEDASATVMMAVLYRLPARRLSVILRKIAKALGQ
jgi:hypothetical protein